MSRSASRAAPLLLLLPLSGCWIFLTAPLLDALPRRSRVAVVLFHESWGVETYQAPPSFVNLPTPRGPPPKTAVAIPHPAAVYASFRRGLAESGAAVLVDDARAQSLPDLVARVPALAAPSPSSPAPRQDARAFPFPIEVGDAVTAQKRWGDPTPRPVRIGLETDVYDYHLARVSPAMPALARELGADGLVEVFLRPVAQVVRSRDGYAVAPMYVWASVTMFGADGRRRYENIFRSDAIPADSSDGPSGLERRLEAFARELGERVASEAFGG